MKRAITMMFFLAFFGVYASGVPRIIRYQAKLTDASGVALDGSQDITFKLYTTETGGTPIWTEAHTSSSGHPVTVTNGLFDVELGTITSLNIAFDDTYWIELQVGTETLSPRERMVAVPYAFRAINADSLDGHSWSEITGVNGWIDDGTVVRLETSSDNVGIGTTSPSGKLQVAGDEVRIGSGGTVNHATGDGDLYVQDVLEVDGNGFFANDLGVTNTVQAGGLDVTGNANVGSFTMSSGATNGYVLTCDASGNGTWQPPTGAADNDWTGAGTGSMYATNTSDNVGIGTTSPTNKLQVISSSDTAMYVSATNTEYAIYADVTTPAPTTTAAVLGNASGVSDPGMAGCGVKGITNSTDPMTAAVVGENVGTMPLTTGVLGIATASPDGWGVHGIGSHFGMVAEGTKTATVNGDDVSGINAHGTMTPGSYTGTIAYGIYATAQGADSNWAGYFADGNVYVKDNVGIGTTSPSSKLSVNASGLSNACVYADATGYTYAYYGRYDANTYGWIGESSGEGVYGMGTKYGVRGSRSGFTNTYGELGTDDPGGTDAVGVMANTSNTGSSNYAIYANADGAGTTNYGIYTSVSSATNDYGGYFSATTSGDAVYGIYASGIYSGSTNTSYTRGAYIYSSSTTQDQYGIYNYATHSGTGGFLYGIRNYTSQASGNSTTEYGIHNYSYRGGDDATNYGIYSHASNGTNVYGVYGYATGASDSCYGVYGTASGGAINFAGYFDGNTQIKNGWLKVGEPTEPTGVGVNTILYHIDFSSTNYWDYVNYYICNGATVFWYNGDADDEYYLSSTVGDGSDDHTLQRLVSPYIWIPNNFTGNMTIELDHQCGLENGYDGGYLEINNGGWSKITSFSSNGYNNSSVAGCNTSCANANEAAWTGLGRDTSITNVISGISSNSWIQLRLAAMQDASVVGNYWYIYELWIKGDMDFYSPGFEPGGIYAEGHIYAQSTAQLGDVAEFFPVKGESSPGDVISMDPKGSKLCYVSRRAMDPFVIGVYSSNPSVLVNSPSQGVPLSLSGRVPVNVVSENGPINPGDYLTSSDIPGYAMKATKPCFVIGRAMEKFYGSDEKGQIICLVSPGWYNPNPSTDGVNSGNYFLLPNQKKIRVIDESITKFSKVFLSMRGDPGSRFWISDVEDGYFEISIAKAPENKIPFDYLVNTPLTAMKINGVVNDEGKERKKAIKYASEAISPCEAWAVLGHEGEKIDTTLFIMSNTPPPPPPDPSKCWTWDPINGYTEHKFEVVNQQKNKMKNQQK